MTRLELVEQLNLIRLLLNDIPKKYSFLDEEKLKKAIDDLIKEYE
jgi:hypothetical protein